jgi:3-oxoacyl-[acyl-carrier protein] reductase
MDLGLKGARVLVTAASSGLGAATARQFSLEGARVVINSRTLDKLQDTAAKIVAESTNPVFTMAADVSDAEAARRMVNNAAETLGGLDILVTNAGGPPAGTFDHFSIDDWRKAIDLNLVSTIALIQAALPHLRQSSRAAILTVTSMSARQPIDNLILSNTVRPAVLGLTKSLSQELGAHGIRVNSILPGTTDTDRIVHLMEARSRANNTTIEEEKAKAGQSVPLQRIGKPEEFANAAVFLCSPAAGFITGVMLQVDGGAIKSTF